MVNVTMCNNENCNLSSECARFVYNIDKHQQSYLDSPVEDCENKRYELFIERDK